MWHILQRYLSLRKFYQLSTTVSPLFSWLAMCFIVYGLIAGLFLAPADYQQGDAYRVIYIHVPSAFLSLTVYSVMAVSSFIFLIWRIKLADVIAAMSAPIGASFTILALLTGSIWGKPMWGTWWIWDARLTTELILLFIYIGIISLRQALPLHVGQSAVAIVVLLGFLDIPLIHYSVVWWHTLHQGPTLAQFDVPHIAAPMLYPLIAMILGFFFYYVALLLNRCRYEILAREKQSDWVRTEVLGDIT